MHETSERFTWWHRDELQVVAVYLLIIFFFGRYTSVITALLVLATVPVACFWVLRWWGTTGRYTDAIRTILTRLPRHPWDRSRLAMSILSVVIVGALFVHRLSLFLEDYGTPVPVEASFATPLDLYWVLFLGWYGLVWLAIVVFLVGKWKTGAAPIGHRFLEGLVGSMFFYHGLPGRSRVITFAAGFILGGLPTVYAVQIDPADPSGHTTAALLVIPLVALILFGAWFASRWVGSTPSGEV